MYLTSVIFQCNTLDSSTGANNSELHFKFVSADVTISNERN